MYLYFLNKETCFLNNPKPLCVSFLPKHSEDFWQYNTFQYWRTPLPPVELADITDASEARLAEAAGQDRDGAAEVDMESWHRSGTELGNSCVLKDIFFHAQYDVSELEKWEVVLKIQCLPLLLNFPTWICQRQHAVICVLLQEEFVWILKLLILCKEFWQF